MLCSHCREQLAPLLCDALSAAERAQVQAHLAACPDCARELRALQNIGETLASLPAAPVPPRVRQNVRSALGAPKRRAFPFLLPNFGARGLAWGGALAVGAIGLMLVARPLQNNYETAPASDISAGAVSAPRAQNAAGARAAAPGAKSLNTKKAVSNSVAVSKAKTPVANAPKTNAPAANAPTIQTPATAAPATAATAAAPKLPAPKTPGVAPKSDNFLFSDGAVPKLKAPAATPKGASKTPPSGKPVITASQQPQLSDAVRTPSPARADNKANLATPQPSVALRSDGAGTTLSRAATAPDTAPRSKANAKNGASQLAAPFGLAGSSGPAVMKSARAGAQPNWTNGAVTATLTRSAPRALRGNEDASDNKLSYRAGGLGGGFDAPQAKTNTAQEPQQNAPAPPVFADGHVSALPAPATAAPATAAPATAAPDSALGANLAAVSAPVTLSVRAAKNIGSARLVLIAPDGETELWRGTLGTAPLQIPLPGALVEHLKLQSGQKIRARLEQINAAGQSTQSLPLELSWP